MKAITGDKRFNVAPSAADATAGFWNIDAPNAEEAARTAHREHAADRRHASWTVIDRRARKIFTIRTEMPDVVAVH